MGVKHVLNPQGASHLLSLLIQNPLSLAFLPQQILTCHSKKSTDVANITDDSLVPGIVQVNYARLHNVRALAQAQLNGMASLCYSLHLCFSCYDVCKCLL